jgi:hypothetical protein
MYVENVHKLSRVPYRGVIRELHSNINIHVCYSPSGHVHYNGQHSEVSSSSGLHKGQRVNSVQSAVHGVTTRMGERD